MDFEETGCEGVGQTELALERVWRWALFNMVINP